MTNTAMRFPIGDKLLVVLITILINLSLFLLIPLLSETAKQERETYEPATVVTMSEPQPLQEQRQEREKQEMQEEEPTQMPEKASMPRNRQKPSKPQMNLDMPNFEFAPDMDVQQGMQVAAPAPQRASSPDKTSFKLTEVDKQPRVVRRIQPVYPYEARKKQITGKVVLRFLVDKEGKVSRVSVVRAKPEGIFEENAVKAVKKWQFKPGYYDGEPVPTWITLPIRFNM
jgi:protein TonB